jgi:NitT/TauT family transport system substrate-binding protein
MSAARWADFYQTVSEQGMYPKGLDVSKAYTLQFVNHKVGMDLKH